MTEANHTRIRVLHVVGSMNRGGAETWLMHVLRHIDRDRFQMDFLVHSAEQGAYDEEIRSLGGNLRVCPYTKNPLAYARALHGVLNKYGPYDVIHSHVQHFAGLIMPIAKYAGIPKRIAHSHSDTSYMHANASPVRELYYLLSELLIRTFATDGLAVSHNAGSALFGRQLRRDDRFRVFYGGIDLTPFHPKAAHTCLRAEMGIPEEGFVVGHVGRFDHEKNHKFIVEIASFVNERDASIYFLLVGDGALRHDIETAVAEARLTDRIIFAGPRSDVPQLMMTAMDIFLLPSLFEGLPLVLLEAQAAGLTALVSNVVSPEVEIVPQIIHRQHLEDPVPWADWIVDAKRRRSNISPEEAYLSMFSSQFNVETNIHLLEGVYDRERS